MDIGHVIKLKVKSVLIGICVRDLNTQNQKKER